MYRYHAERCAVNPAARAGVLDIIGRLLGINVAIMRMQKKSDSRTAGGVPRNDGALAGA
jgi:hypothetical protein